MAKVRKLTLAEIDRRILARLDDRTGPARVNGKCVYRTPKGRGCAVGCLIPAKFYLPSAENISITSLMPKRGKWVPRHESCGFLPLAKMLNRSGIPANTKIHDRLSVWQHRHDSETNWIGKKYVGPRD